MIKVISIDQSNMIMRELSVHPIIHSLKRHNLGLPPGKVNLSLSHFWHLFVNGQPLDEQVYGPSQYANGNLKGYLEKVRK